MDVLHEKLTKIKEIRYRMKKIMFNDRYGLTQAVIEGRKTMTRRLEFDDELQKIIADSDSYYYDDGYLVFATQDVDIHYVKTRYKVGEVVAVAQSYNEVVREFTSLALVPGSTNKMFVKAELMPHRIRITGIKCERLQDISDEDCFREGISESWYESTDTTTYGYADEKKGTAVEFDMPREAFASLIDKVSGRGTWERNPWVVVYEFELVK